MDASHLTPPSIEQRSAFTRLEALALTGALGILAAVVLPALANGKQRSLQIVCLNNLRLLGRAITTYNSEHAYTDPWRPVRTSENPVSPLENNAWFQAYTMTNEIQNPRILACPSDSRRPAADFSGAVDGFLSANKRNAAMSYFFGLDSLFVRPDSVVSGDRNIPAIGHSACSCGLIGVPNFNQGGAWSSGLHGASGNLLFRDGHAEEVSSQRLSPAFYATVNDVGSWHLLVP